MSTTRLLPTKFKKPGWILLLAGLVLGIALHFKSFPSHYFDTLWPSLFPEDEKSLFIMAPNNIADEIASILLIVGILFVGFSREKSEDEFLAMARQSSLTWAFVINFSVLLFFVIFFREFLFLKILAYNMFTVGLVYIARFHYLLYIKHPAISDDKQN